MLAVALIVAAAPAGDALAADPVIAAAGDIACAPANPDFNDGRGSANHCRQKYTSDLLVDSGLARVLALGDLQYDSGIFSDFLASYDRSWGRVKSITRPVLGNHEGEWTGYFDYFNGKGERFGPAGERDKGYYSFDVGNWHLIALNSNCWLVSCSKGSTQERWLRADLAAHRSTCTLAYWHHPRFSSWAPPDPVSLQPIWQDLYDAGAEVVLSGHSHHYERFAPQDAAGRLDRATGIRQFIAGGTGAFFTSLATARPNSEVRHNRTFGVLKLTLHPTSYDWRFVPEAGKTFTDSGSELCHGGAGSTDARPPSAPTNLTARAASSAGVDLSWGMAVDDVAVTGYELYRDGELLAATATTSHSDTRLGRSTTHSYRVRALDAAGNRSAFSHAVQVTTSATGAVGGAASATDVRVGIPPRTPRSPGATAALGATAAKRLTRKLLARELGRVFTRRRLYRRSCSPKGRLTRHCRVRWRYRGSAYSGRIVLVRQRSIVAWRYRITTRGPSHWVRELSAKGRYVL